MEEFNNEQNFSQDNRQPFTQRRKARLKAQADKKDSAFLAVFFGFSVFAVWMIFFGSFYLGFTLSNIVFLVIMTLYCMGSGSEAQNKAFAVCCAVLSLLISFIPAIYDNDLNAVIIAAAVALDCAYFDGMWGRCRYAFKDIRVIFEVCNRLFAQRPSHLFAPLRSSMHMADSKNKKTGKIILGVCISVPLAIILMAILKKSDAAFEGLLKKIVSAPNDILWIIIEGLIVFPFIFSFAFATRKKLDREKPEPVEKRFLDSTVINTVLCAVSIVYVIYLISQLSYFMGAFGGILPESFSYAEYARRGFFELCVIAGINLVIIFISGALTKVTDGKRDSLNKALSLFICIFTLLIIATAEAKIVMYIGKYGMTHMRVLPACFLVMLAICFVCAVIRIFNRSFEYMKVLIICGSIMLIAVSAADVDKTIARYNIEKYLNHTLTDLSGIENLGPSATPEIYRLLETDDEYAKAYVGRIMNNRLGYYNFDYSENGITVSNNQKIGCFNLSQEKEIKAIKNWYSESGKEYDSSVVRGFFIQATADFDIQNIALAYKIGKSSGSQSAMHADGSVTHAYEGVEFRFNENEFTPSENIVISADVIITLPDGKVVTVRDAVDEYYPGNNEILFISITKNGEYYDAWTSGSDDYLF
ncbi:MAG: DUF4173 domain-containing protein [Clostridia bacterium]|nr:DUF4173 domain-containing protein [Clostridia bacterium]